MSTTNLTGKHIGNYVLEKILGRGSYGTVYLGRHPEIGREVAIKLLDRPPGGETGDRFVVEARAAVSIRHPNIIDVYDLGRTGEGWLYYVMEHLSGRSLGDHLQELRQTGEESLARALLPMVQQICSALQAAHQAGVVHRDLKPDNILLMDEQPRTVKILDFGLAKLLAGDEHNQVETCTGQVLGTPRYMSPEQAAGEVYKICPQTDLYALGVILYEALCGAPPFEGENTHKTQLLQMYQPPPPLLDRAPELPPGVAELVMHCLKKSPHDRPASASEVASRYAAALEEDAQALACSESSEEQAAEGVQGRRRTSPARRGALVAALLFGAALLTLGWMFLEPGPARLADQREPRAAAKLTVPDEAATLPGNRPDAVREVPPPAPTVEAKAPSPDAAPAIAAKAPLLATKKVKRPRRKSQPSAASKSKPAPPKHPASTPTEAAKIGDRVTESW